MKINYIIGLFMVFITIACRQQDKPTVVATSAWTAAYVRAAGIEEVITLAPVGMQHPTEYELEIDDIQNIKNSKLIICGGYEIMMDKIREGLKIEDDRILEIATDYDVQHIKQSILKIADKFGTERTARQNILEIENAFSKARKKILKNGIDKERIIAQFFLQTFARQLDLKIIEIFGPEHLEIFDIKDLMELEFTMILDNQHNPVAGPLIESKNNVKVAYLINFPGTHGTQSLVDVIKYNADQIIKASGDEGSQKK